MWLFMEQVLLKNMKQRRKNCYYKQYNNYNRAHSCNGSKQRIRQHKRVNSQQISPINQQEISTQEQGDK